MYRSFLWGLGLLLASGASSTVRDNISPSHGRDVWTPATGFPGGYVYSIAQTSDGYIWMGTSKGLVRYGGWKFTLLPEAGSNPDTKIQILSVVADSNELWAADDHTRLFRYSGDQSVRAPDNGQHNRYLIAAFGKTNDGGILFASEAQGLVEYQHGSARVLLDPRLMPSSPTALAQTADGSLWIGTRDAGLFRLALASGGAEINHFAALTSSRVNCLLPIGGSTLLIGTDKGLVSLRGGNTTEVSPELAKLEVVALAGGRDGNVWIGSDQGVFKADATGIDREGKIRVLDNVNVHGTVSALFEDRDGDLWVGEADLVERCRASGFTTYLSSAGLPCTNCGAIDIDQQDRVWFAPWNGGLFRLSQGSIQSIEVAGLKDDTIYSIAGGGAGELWIARKYGGLTRLPLQGDTLQAASYTQRDGLASDSVYAVYRAEDGTVWAGTLGEGLSRFRDGKWRTFDTRDGLPSKTITAITGNAAGDVFVGTRNGLAVLRNDHWTSYTAQDGLPPGPITSLFLDNKKILWIGTTKGISFCDSGTVHVPLGAPNALYGEILGIAESHGWLWITTDDHVLRVKRTALMNQSFAEGDYREFGLAEGLPSTGGVKRSRSVVLDNRGRIWFSLNQGISFLEPSAFARPAFPVTTRLDGMLVDGRAVSGGSVVHVPAGRHRLTFQYAGVNVSNPADVRYRYRLDNLDPAWSETTPLREIDYTNVQPGEFQFRVTARNPDGIWNGQETTMAFVIDPAYWQTRWFQASSALALLVFILGLYRLRLRRLHQQFEVALHARVNERTRIARELHDTLLQSLHGLMLQFQAARNMLPKRTDDAIRMLDTALDTTEQAITESRGAIHDLRTDPVCSGDLAESIAAAAQELTDSHHANSPAPTFEMTVEGQRKRLAPALQDELYRIAREILRNAFQHAHADRIEIEIQYNQQALRLRIRDNGKGIDPKILKEGGSSGHWGLRGVRERAQQVGGQIDFWSEVGAGTEVQLTVPAAVAFEAFGKSLETRARSQTG